MLPIYSSSAAAPSNLADMFSRGCVYIWRIGDDASGWPHTGRVVGAKNDEILGGRRNKR
jgi:hypothetical protein